MSFHNPGLHHLHPISNRNGGWVIEQLLITLAICAALIPVMSSCIGITGKSLADDASMQDEISIAQLRHIMNVSDDFKVSSDAVSFTYHAQTCMLYCVNGKLVMTPGTVIFLSDLDALSFEDNSGLLLVNYERNNKETTRTLARI